MKLILDYFYPVCGYQEGWCNKMSKCKFRMNVWKVSEKVEFCAYFMKNHPMTDENYKQFVSNRRNISA